MARVTGERATSTTLGYALNLGITVVLMAGLVASAGAVVSEQRQRALETRFEVIGDEVASALRAADRLARTTEKRAAVRVQLPQRVAGQGYAVRVEAASGEVTLVVFDPGGEHAVEVAVENETRVAEGRVPGGPLVIRYDGSDLEVHGAG